MRHLKRPSLLDNKKPCRVSATGPVYVSYSAVAAPALISGAFGLTPAVQGTKQVPIAVQQAARSTRVEDFFDSCRCCCNAIGKAVLAQCCLGFEAGIGLGDAIAKRGEVHVDQVVVGQRVTVRARHNAGPRGDITHGQMSAQGGRPRPRFGRPQELRAFGCFFGLDHTFVRRQKSRKWRM